MFIFAKMAFVTQEAHRTPIEDCVHLFFDRISQTDVQCKECGVCIDRTNGQMYTLTP